MEVKRLFVRVINSRIQLPKIIKSGGVGIELGVAGGYYSNIILKNSSLKCLYSVDRWDDHHNEAEFKKAAELLRRHGLRSAIMAMTFKEALTRFPSDECFDFIYIDGYAHKGQENGKTLRDWYPKLKVGGIFAGHDYNKKYQPTIDAVDSFCDSVGITPIIVPGDDETISRQDEYESWYIIKQ